MVRGTMCPKAVVTNTTDRNLLFCSCRPGSPKPRCGCGCTLRLPGENPASSSFLWLLVVLGLACGLITSISALSSSYHLLLSLFVSSSSVFVKKLVTTFSPTWGMKDSFMISHQSTPRPLPPAHYHYMTVVNWDFKDYSPSLRRYPFLNPDQ